MTFARVWTAVAICIGVMAACSDSTGGGGGGRSTNITVGNNFFSPTPDTVSAGQVMFTWANSSNGHNVTWLTGPGTLPANSTTKSSGTHQVALQLGTYTYHCTVHGGMNGTIVVE
jgi:plastocyanin